ncbi:fibronectin type III domain-containing protein [uncultured Chitinophaga sp.]|jgi:Fibronectin type III domain.|uniref:fibronectin type III domain-containing protein n=1 Tax=uncultured Chitinophaga sp. TaxID=339340 RepID=UPI00263996BC|nr:fibronectin type III domain-containing protein [uncultured Chitinophaga sp.]
MAVAQQYPVKVQVQTLQPVSAQLSNLYTGTQARMLVTLINTDLQKPVLRVRLRLNIKGTTVALRNRDYGYYPEIALDAGIPVQLSLNDLAPYFNIENMEVSGVPRQQLAQSGKLPDGFYNFCVEVVEVNSGQLVSNAKQGCAPPVWISTSEPPLLNLPRKGESVAFREPLNIVFNWTPRHMGSPNAAFQTEYEFTLVELWDNGVLPEAGFSTMPPLYQTTTPATTLLYGPAEPPLLPGKRYAWRIRAKAKQGVDDFDVFLNNGYSEIFYFTLQEDCQPPQQPVATVQDGRISINWLPQPKMFEYVVEYREQNKTNAEWFNVKTGNTSVMIYDAVPGRKYEYRVGGSCSLGSQTMGELHGFTVPSRDTSRNKNCGLLPDIKLANQTPIQALQPDDQIMAGDFPVRLLQVKGAGSFSGYGYITIPFLGYNRLKVKFDNITVNTDRQLIGGVIMTTFDPVERQVVKVDSVVTAFSNLAGVINDLVRLAIDEDISTLQPLIDSMREAIKEDLPEPLQTRASTALDNMEQAKKAYDEAKSDYENAATPEEKAKAREKMEQSGKAYQAAQDELKAVEKEKAGFLKDYANIIRKALKQIMQEYKDSIQQQRDAKRQKESALGFSEGTADSMNSDTLATEEYLEEVDAAAILMPETISKLNAYYAEEFRTNRFELARLLAESNDNEEGAARLSEELKKGAATLGKYIYEEKNKKTPEQEIITGVKEAIYIHLENVLIEKVYK